MGKLPVKFELRWSITSFLTLSMVLVVTILIALSTILDIRRARGIFREEHREKGLLLARGLNDILANDLYFADVDALRDTAALLGSQPDITYIQILTPEGRPVAGSDKEQYPLASVDSEFGPGAGQVTETRLQFNGDALEVSSPIQIGSETIGVVQFGFSAGPVEAEIKRLILQHIWQGLLLIAMGVVTCYVISRYATRPLQTLAAAASNIGRDDLNNPISVGGVKEVVALGNALDGMKLELHGLYLDLEQQVADRTHELSIANEELKIEISERKRAQETLAQHAISLESINAELEALSYSVSHDLRAPLRGMVGLSQALLEDYADKLDGQGKDYLQRVSASGQRMGLLIDDLLKLSQMTRDEMRRETVDLSALVREIALELQESQPDRRVEFVIAEGLIAKGDERLLRIALENLLGNAWKFTAKHPSARIEFGVTQHEGEPAYFVRDDGAGFEMVYAELLFGAFQRLHSPFDFEGTGIGLASVKRIIGRHGGRVWAEGVVEQGATFYFTL